MSINVGEITEARSAVVAMAKQMLAGELSYIAGSRSILAMLPTARIDNMDEFMVFVGIHSETDRFPLGAERELWQQQALEAMQPEFDKAERWARSFGEPACIKVIERFERHPLGDF